MSNLPEVTVIIPAYNEAERLPSCMEALLQAKCAYGWEIIVVDDASTDESAAIAESLGARVLRLPENSGVAAARNAGAKAASGRYLFFVDADVVPTMAVLNMLVEKLRSEPGISAVGACPGPNLSDTWSSNLLCMQGDWYTKYFVSAEMNVPCFPSECGMVRREVFWAAGGFAESHGGVGMEEFALGHAMERGGWRNVLLPEARYETYYDTVAHRCRELLVRTARWVPLFLHRRRLEPVVGSKIPAEEALSCLALAGTCAASIPGVILPSFLWVPITLMIVHWTLQIRFVHFVWTNKRGGRALALFAWPALAAMHFSILVGFSVGLVATAMRMLRKEKD